MILILRQFFLVNIDRSQEQEKVYQSKSEYILSRPKENNPLIKNVNNLELQPNCQIIVHSYKVPNLTNYPHNYFYADSYQEIQKNFIMMGLIVSKNGHSNFFIAIELNLHETIQYLLSTQYYLQFQTEMDTKVALFSQSKPIRQSYFLKLEPIMQQSSQQSLDPLPKQIKSHICNQYESQNQIGISKTSADLLHPQNKNCYRDESQQQMKKLQVYFLNDWLQCGIHDGSDAERQDIFQNVQNDQSVSSSDDLSVNRQQTEFYEEQRQKGQWQRIQYLSEPNYFSQFCDQFKDQDFAFLLKYKKKLYKTLQYLLQNWQIIRIQFEIPVKTFVQLFKLKIQKLNDYNQLYEQVAKLVKKLQILTAHVVSVNNEQVPDMVTDILLKHYISAQENKYNRKGLYYVKDQFNNREVEINEYISQTFRYEENPFWQSIYFFMHCKISKNLAQKHPNHPKEVLSIHQIEPANLGNLLEAKFLYEGKNICDWFTDNTKMALCGKIKARETQQAQSQFMQELIGLLNNQGGVILWDCSKHYLSLMPNGQSLQQVEKISIQNSIQKLISKITPQIVYGVNYLLQFVPIAINYASKQSWNNGKFKLSFKQGQYVTMLKVFNPEIQNIYTHGDDGVVYFKQNVFEKAADMSQNMILQRKNMKQALQMLSKIPEQNQQKRQQCLQVIKANLSSLNGHSNSLGQPRNRYVQQMIRQMNNNEQQWQESMLNQMKEAYRSLLIPETLRYYKNSHKEADEHKVTIRDFYFLPFNQPTLNSFFYKQRIIDFSNKYQKIYEKKMKERYLKEFYSASQYQRQENSNIQTQRFCWKKLECLKSIQSKLFYFSTWIGHNITAAQSQYLWQKNMLNECQKRYAQKLKTAQIECQILCRVLFFLRAKLNTCGNQINHLNNKYLSQSLSIHKSLQNKYKQLNNKRCLLLQNSKNIQKNCKEVLQIHAQKPEIDTYLNQITKNIHKITEKQMHCFGQILDQLQIRTLVKYLTNFNDLQNGLFYKTNLCKNTLQHKNNSNCLKRYLQQKFQPIFEFSKNIQTQNQLLQERINQDLWQDQVQQIIQRVHFYEKDVQKQLSENAPLLNAQSSNYINHGPQSCLIILTTANLANKLKNIQTAIKSLVSNFKIFKDIIKIADDYIIRISELMQQFMLKYQIYQQELNLLDQYRLMLQEIWPEFFSFSPVFQQFVSAQQGKPLKSPKKPLIHPHPSQKFQNASLLIAAPNFWPQIKQKLTVQGFQCEIVLISQKYRIKSAANIAILFHDKPHSQISRPIRQKASQFTFNRKATKIAALTDHIKLCKRNSTNEMSRQDFNNLVQWLKVQYSKENMQLLKCQCQNGDSQYYLKTQSKMSTALIFLVLGQYAEQAKLKNPSQEDLSSLSVVYSSQRGPVL